MQLSWSDNVGVIAISLFPNEWLSKESLKMIEPPVPDDIGLISYRPTWSRAPKNKFIENFGADGFTAKSVSDTFKEKAASLAWLKV